MRGPAPPAPLGPPPAPRADLARISRNSLLQLAVLAWGTATSAAIAILIGQYLGPAALGQWSAIGAALSLALGLFALGLDAPMARRMVAEPERASLWLGNAAALRALALALCCIAIVAGASVSGRPGSAALPLLACYSAYAALASLVALLNRACQAIQRFAWQLAPPAAATLLGAGAGWACLARGGDLVDLALCLLLGQAVGLLALASLLATEISPRPRFQAPVWRTLLAESWPLALSGLFLAGYARIDALLLAGIAGTRAAGLYGAAYSFLLLLGAVGSGIQTAVFPALAQAYLESPAAAGRLLRTTLIAMLALGICAILASWTFLGPLLIAFYGPDFREAVLALPILMAGGLFLLLNNTYGMTLNAIGQQRFAPYVTLSALGINVAANLLLIPRLGLLGAAWTTLLTEAATLLLCRYFVRLTLKPRDRPGLGRTPMPPIGTPADGLARADGAPSGETPGAGT